MNQHEAEFHDLIEQLQAERPSVLEPNRHFTNQLRSRLLATYEKKPGWELGRLTSTATAFAILALVIFGGWYIASSQQPTMIAGESIQTTRLAETAESANQLEVIHSTLRVSRVMNKNYTWQAIIEHWQTADSQYSRTMITDESGKLLHFAQSDGQYLWQDVGINPITSPNRRVLDFSQEELDSLSASSEAAAPFYSEVGWDSLAGALVATDWNCQTHQCVYEKLEKPPALGIEPGAFASGQYGGLIGTEEINGRTVDIFEFRYNEPEAAADDTLPRYRIAKVDSETFRVVSITDYDGEQVMRSIELINREPITMAPQDFQAITSDAFAAMAVGPRETIPFENGLQIAGYVLLPDSADQDNLQFTIFWQSEEEVEDDIFRGIIHVVDENGALVTEANGPLRWQADNGDIIAQISFRDIEQWPNGRYQIYGGVYDQAAGRNLLSDSGEEIVLLDTIVLEESATDVADIADTQIPFGDNVALTYSHVIQGATTSRDETHILRFLWYARQRPTENLVAFVHLLDENGQVVQQQDQELAWTVAAGEMVKPGFTEYALQSVEMTVPDGRYQVQVGLYDGTTGQRVTTTEATVQGETAVLVDTIRVVEAETQN